MGIRRRDHVTPVTVSLHWIPTFWNWFDWLIDRNTVWKHIEWLKSVVVYTHRATSKGEDLSSHPSLPMTAPLVPQWDLFKSVHTVPLAFEPPITSWRFINMNPIGYKGLHWCKFFFFITYHVFVSFKSHKWRQEKILQRKKYVFYSGGRFDK